MGIFDRFRLGDGKLTPELRTALEAEGLVLVEEGLRGKIRYDDFKAPGKRFYGKVTVERIGLAISEHRFAVYCRSGSVELIDSPFSEPRLALIEISAEQDDELAIRIDYDRFDEPEVSGRITITARTPRAGEIADQIRARVARP